MNEKPDSVCVDASLALAWLFADTHNEQADGLWEEWALGNVELVAPPMFHAEVISSIRKRVFFKDILPGDGERLFAVYSEIPVRIIAEREIYRRAWQLAKKYNLPVCYDMQYLAVAELMDCALWTLDRKLVNAARSNSRVKLVGGQSA